MIGFVNWNVDPAIFHFLGREVRWYGLFFAVGLLMFGPWIEERIWKHERLPEKWLNSLYIYVVLGTIIGARLGHVLFYDPSFYLAHPSEIIKVWNGGLASHGGTLGVIIAVWLYSRNVTKKPILFALDRLAVPVGLVAAMIRLGNLMNSEIFGRFTNLPWGFRFLHSIEYREMVGQPTVDRAGHLVNIDSNIINSLPACHPTQIYEALSYLLVFAICLWLYWKRDAARKYRGLITGWFLTLVFAARFFIEMIKNVQEPWEINMVDHIGINMGQLLSIPFILVGITLIIRAYRRPIISDNLATVK